MTRFAFPLLRRASWWVVRSGVGTVYGGVHRLPASIYQPLIVLAAGADRPVRVQAAVAAMLRLHWAEALRQGTRGLAVDLRLLASDWGFALTDVRAPVLLWHGEADTTTPIAMGRYLARTIPRCQATYYPAEGHFTYINHWAEILTALRGFPASAG